MSKNKLLLFELWDFLKIKRVWWLMPTIILLILVGIVISLMKWLNVSNNYGMSDYELSNNISKSRSGIK